MTKTIGLGLPSGECVIDGLFRVDIIVPRLFSMYPTENMRLHACQRKRT